MKTYVLVTGVLFGLLTIAHVVRIFLERSDLASDPWYMLATLATAALCFWSWRLLRAANRQL